MDSDLKVSNEDVTVQGAIMASCDICGANYNMVAFAPLIYKLTGKVSEVFICQGCLEMILNFKAAYYRAENVGG